MTQLLLVYFAAGLVVSCHCVSTKLDFVGGDKTKESSPEDDDVEVKHTIVVSTKLKNRGFHSADESQPLFLSRVHKKEDSGEVPIVKAYKSVDTTAIRTPDSRLRPPSSRTFNRNTRDEYDIYPNTGFSTVWKPSSFFNNINYWSVDDLYNAARGRQDNRGFNRRVGGEGASEFYCRKCRELSGKGCVQKTNNVFRESTTQKIKVDGKLANLN